MQPKFRFILERLDPAKAIRISPHRIKYPAEIDIHFPSSLLEKMRKQEAHFKKGQRIFVGKMELVPEFLCRRFCKKLGFKFIPFTGQGAAFGADTSGKDIQKMQGPGYSPATQIATACTAPVVGSKLLAGRTNLTRDIDDHLCPHATFLMRIFGCELRIGFLQFDDIIFEGNRCTWELMFQVFLPVDPGLHVLAIV